MGPLDRVKETLFALVRGAVARVDYMCAYRGTVVSQSGQTVDVTLDDPRMPGMSALPIQSGIPGATVEVANGARVLVAFENGDPAKPVAILWDQGASAKRVSLPVTRVLELGSENLIPGAQGVVTGEGIDPFTGLTYFALSSASTKVLAPKA